VWIIALMTSETGLRKRGLEIDCLTRLASRPLMGPLKRKPRSHPMIEIRQQPRLIAVTVRTSSTVASIVYVIRRMTCSASKRRSNKCLIAMTVNTNRLLMRAIQRK
jgi:hypothetical protein